MGWGPQPNLGNLTRFTPSSYHICPLFLLFHKMVLRCGWPEGPNSQLDQQSGQSLLLSSTAPTWFAFQTYGGAQNRCSLARFHWLSVNDLLHQGPHMDAGCREGNCSPRRGLCAIPPRSLFHQIFSPHLASQEEGEGVPSLPSQI